MCPTDLGRVAPLSVQPGTTEHTYVPACPKCHPQTIKRKGGRVSFLAKLPRLTQSACAQCAVHFPFGSRSGAAELLVFRPVSWA